MHFWEEKKTATWCRGENPMRIWIFPDSLKQILYTSLLSQVLHLFVYECSTTHNQYFRQVSLSIFKFYKIRSGKMHVFTKQCRSQLHLYNATCLGSLLSMHQLVFKIPNSRSNFRKNELRGVLLLWPIWNLFHPCYLPVLFSKCLIFHKT